MHHDKARTTSKPLPALVLPGLRPAFRGVHFVLAVSMPLRRPLEGRDQTTSSSVTPRSLRFSLQSHGGRQIFQQWRRRLSDHTMHEGEGEEPQKGPLSCGRPAFPQDTWSGGVSTPCVWGCPSKHGSPGLNDQRVNLCGVWREGLLSLMNSALPVPVNFEEGVRAPWTCLCHIP